MEYNQIIGLVVGMLWVTAVGAFAGLLLHHDACEKEPEMRTKPTGWLLIFVIWLLPLACILRAGPWVAGP